MRIEEWVRQSVQKLDGSETPRLDAELLLAKALGADRLHLMMYPKQEIGEAALRQAEEWLLRRAEGCPVQYLLGEREFMGLNFFVEEGVLIPRPDTEILVEGVLSRLKDPSLFKDPEETALFGLEIGCGSGVISLSLLSFCKDLRMEAVDINPKALELTCRNARRLGLAERICLYASDLFSELGEKKYDFIVSNPPYIRTELIETLQREVRDYEPRTALDGGEDGLFFYRTIAEKGKDHLKEGGFLALEIGHDQGEELESLLKEQGYSQLRIEKDLAGRDRTVQAVLISYDSCSSRKDDSR
ncbi:MAG: peptide chain release factor N(5)-glutamine methyltransferase [Peptostreptococcaceae bacterium]|nr:peptide chain release factor N(5)-glutamine methyltransferase [Peptostreptococcaceae bacterium]